jgi:hypothetical protein
MCAENVATDERARVVCERIGTKRF